MLADVLTAYLLERQKTPEKTSIKLCYKQNQLFKQLKPPAVLQETLRSCWVLSTWPSPQHTVGTEQVHRL